MAATSIHIRPVKGGSEAHNFRTKKLGYVREDITPNNEHWSIGTISNRRADIKQRYFASVGQKMQAKATPIREGVVVIQEDTTINQLRELADRLEKRFGIHTFQIYTHKDEGAAVWNGLANEWKPNYHAHMIFDWTDGHTGKTIKLNQHDMAEMQTITAQYLNMERGVSSDRKHLSAIQYKNQVEAEKAAQLQKECRELEQTKQEGIEKIGKVQEELEQTKEKLKEVKTDIKVQKLKGAAADTGAALMKAGTTVFDATTSLFNAGKVKRQELEIKGLKSENYTLQTKVQNLEGHIRTANTELARERETHRMAIRNGEARMKAITEMFPSMENAKENIEELRSMGIENSDIRQLLTGKEISYTGNLYDRERRKSYPVKNIKIDIAKSRNGITTIWMNDTHFKTFFRELWNKLQKVLGLDISRGLHL